MKKIMMVVFMVLALSLAYQSTVWAEENSTPLPSLKLQDLIQQALKNNPEIAAAKAEWLAAKKRILASWGLPDPVGEYDIMGPMVETMTGPQKNRFAISQEVPFPAKLWEKRKAAKAEAEAVYARYRALERDITTKITKLYDELYFVDASLDTLTEIKELLKKLESSVQSRYADRSGSQRDVAKAEAEFSMSLEKIYRFDEQREIVTAQMNAILNQDPMTQIGKPILPQKRELNKPLMELINLAVKNRQEIKEAEAIASKTHYAKRLAELAYIPDINVGFEYVRVGSGATDNVRDGQNTWMFPLSVNLPIWQNRIIPEIQEAQKLEEAQAAKLIAAKNRTFFEVKNAYFRFKSSGKIADLYEMAIVPQAKLALSADQSGYEAGKADFLNLLDSERVYLNAKLSQVEFYIEALKAYADLVWATGLDFESTEKEQKK